MSVIAALVLAAGFSSRMGRFKPLLPLGGQTVIDHVIDTFRAAGLGRITVVTGHQADALEARLHGAGVHTVRNPDHAQGMYSSVRCGIASLADDVQACLLLPVDIPLVRPATLAALAASHRADGPAVCYPRFGREAGHPPLIARRVFREILADDGTRGLRAVLARHDGADTMALDVADEGVLLDMDTPEDYRRLAVLAHRRDLPSVAECEAILALHGVAEPVRRHGRAVAAVAQALARQLGDIDPRLVGAAGLLHDILRAQPDHAAAGARLITQLGHPAVAALVATHMDLDACPPRPGPTSAAAVLYLADKLVREDRRVTLAQRFGPALQRHAGQPDALAAARRRLAQACQVQAAIEARTALPCEALLLDCGVPS